MKKTYLQPWANEKDMEQIIMICSSGVTSGKGIGYGGVDEEGEKDPAARNYGGMWEEEAESEEF